MKQYFWSYNMPTHWQRAHSSQQMPPSLVDAITPSALEVSRLALLKVAQASKRKREAREAREAEKAENAKRAKAQEAEAAQPLGRGQRTKK